MLDRLITAKWALEPFYHERLANIILAGKLTVFRVDDRREPYFEVVTPSAIGNGRAYEYLPKIKGKSGKVAIVPIMGAMSRYGDLCSWGTEDIGAWIMEANADDSVSAIVLEINSPGGEVDGTEMLGYIVKNSEKPVVAYVAGMAASAAYWVASQAREIVMESKTSSEVGSIGVLAMHVDASKFYEKEGLKVTIIRSEGSDDKALFNSIEPLTDEMLADVKAQLAPIKSQFISTVKAGRTGISDEVFTGKMYPGGQAIKLGMADRIGFLGDAVRRADELARVA